MSGEFVAAQSAADCEASLGRSILRDNSKFAHQSPQPTHKVARHSQSTSAIVCVTTTEPNAFFKPHFFICIIDHVMRVEHFYILFSQMEENT